MQISMSCMSFQTRGASISVIVPSSGLRNDASPLHVPTEPSFSGSVRLWVGNGDLSMSTINLPPLPWARDALAPIISRDTVDSHYDKHHRTYVEKTNVLLEGRQVQNLDQLVIEASRDEKQKKLFNNAAQV